MLYDPKWETTVSPVTKPDIYALPTLIAWLEKQPAEKTYCYLKRGSCLLAQYFRSFGFTKVRIGGFTIDLDDQYGIKLPRSFEDIPVAEPRTFGAALARARKMLACAE
jgi:hypothetical protein